MLIYWIFSLVVLSATPVSAKMEFLPENTADNVGDVRKELVGVLPWSKQIQDDSIRNQLHLVARLRRDIPRYQEMAEQKPGPYVISVDRHTVSEITGPLFTSEFFKAITQSLRNREVFQKIDTPLEEGDEQVVLQILSESMERHIQEGADLAQGLLTGIANSQSPEIKRDIFTAGGPNHQLAVVQATEIDRQALEAKFEPTRVGIPENEASLAELIAKVHHSTRLQIDLFADLTLYSVFLQNGVTPESLKKVSTALKKMDQSVFNFLKTDGEFTFSTVLSTLKPQVAKKVNSIRKNIEADHSQVTTRSVEVVDNIATLYEVHPFLGVYRGCIGGDCSTTSSWGFSYSPFEHTFYIFVNNNPVGYITATRLETQEGPTLYIKDVSGENLSPKVIEAILNVFPQLASYYGVNVVSIASSTFTIRENHFAPIKRVMGQFDNRGPRYSQGDLFLNRFQDENIRKTIGGFPSISKEYDKPEVHRSSVRLRPDPESAIGLRVRVESGSLESFQPSSEKEALLFALRQMSLDTEMILSSEEGLNISEARQLFAVLGNPNRIRIADHLQLVELWLKKFGIPMSKSFRRDHEELFWRGFLESHDALDGHGDKSLYQESVDYLIAAIRRSADITWLIPIVSRWWGKIENLQEYQNLLSVMKSRAMYRDFIRVCILAEGRSPTAKQVLLSENFQPLREMLLLKMIQGERISAAENFFANSITQFVNKLVHKVNRSSTRDVRRNLGRVREYFALNNEITNPQLREWFDQFAYLNFNEPLNTQKLQELLQSFAKKGVPLNQAFVELLIKNEAWKRDDLTVSYHEILAKNLDSNELYLAYWAMYAAGDQNAFAYLLNNKAVMLEIIQQYVQNSSNPNPKNFAARAPYSTLLRLPFKNIAESIFHYDGSLEPLLEKVGLHPRDFFEDELTTKVTIRSIFDGFSNEEMLNRATASEEYREFLFDALLRWLDYFGPSYADVPYLSYERYFDLLGTLTNQQIPGVKQLQQVMIEKLNSIQTSAYWWKQLAYKLVYKKFVVFDDLEFQAPMPKSSEIFLWALSVTQNLHPTDRIEIPLEKQEEIMSEFEMSENIRLNLKWITPKATFYKILASTANPSRETLRFIKSVATNPSPLSNLVYAFLTMKRNNLKITGEMLDDLRYAYNNISPESVKLDPDLDRAFAAELFPIVEILRDNKKINMCSGVSNVYTEGETTR